MRDWRAMFAPGSVGTNVAAGIAVAMVAIPLNLALAVACGLPPSAGLVSGAVGGAIGAVFGGARLAITGPEIALAPMTAAIVAAHGVDGLALATAIAGIVQVVLGLLGAGRAIHLLPRPVIVGFLIAVALVVFDTQLPHVVGLHDGVAISAMRSLPRASSSSFVTLGVAALVTAAMIALPKVAPRAPAPLLALSAAVVVTLALDLDVERLEPLATGALSVRWPAVSGRAIAEILPAAIGLGLLASVDSLLCAVSIDARTSGPRHRPDQELVAQGLANLACACFGAMPVAAAVVRSAAAIEARASTRLAALVQSAALLAVLLALGPYLAAVPFAALAAVLLVVAAKLIDLGGVLGLVRARRIDAVVVVATTAAILAWGFVQGLVAGLALATALFARDAVAAFAVQSSRHGERVEIHLCGPLAFLVQERLARELETALADAREVVIDLAGVTSWDPSGLAVLRGSLVRAKPARARVRPGPVPRGVLVREFAGIAAIDDDAPTEVRWFEPEPKASPSAAERWAVEVAE